MNHYQTIFGEGTGNCYSTCIGNLLGLEPDKVPNFCADHRESWMEATEEWLRDQGLFIITYDEDPFVEHPLYQQSALMIASGMGPRGCQHSVLWKNGELLHDPHPSGDGLVDVPTEFDLLFVLDAKLLFSKMNSWVTQ